MPPCCLYTLLLQMFLHVLERTWEGNGGVISATALSACKPLPARGQVLDQDVRKACRKGNMLVHASNNVASISRAI